MQEDTHRKWQIGIEIAKLLVTLTLAVSLIIFIQHPNSVLSKERTEEELKRERARLLIEIIQMEAADDQKRAIEVLRYSYDGFDADLLSQVASIVSVELLNRDIETVVTDTEQDADCQRISSLISQTQVELLRARTIAESEAKSGAISGGMPGQGRVYRELQEQAEQIEEKLLLLEQRFESDCS